MREAEMVDVDRREFLRKTLAAGVLIVPVSGMVAGCATAGGGDQEQAKGDVSAKNPLGVDPEASLEVITFAGGLKTTFPEVQAAYKSLHKGAKVDVKGMVNINSLQPRFAGGNPPDLVDDSGAQKIPLGALVGGKQLADLGPLLDAPAAGGDGKKVRETLVDGTVDVGSYNGTFHAMNYVLFVYGLWYSQPLFDKRGWEMPTQWPDFVTLCGEMKAAGIAPLGFGGQNATQYITTTMLTMAAKAGGPDVLVKIDNLEPGAWEQAAVGDAATAIEELAGKKYFLPGAAALTHTQAQTEWVKGEVGCYPNASWIENEMKSATPKGFEMVMAPTPSLTANDAMPAETLYSSPGESFVVPRKASNARGGMEFLRHMLSKDNAMAYTDETGSLTVVQAANDAVQPKTSGLRSTQEAVRAAGENTVTYIHNLWYGDLHKACTQAMADLLAGRKNAEQYVKACQAAADKTAGDDKIEKYTRK
ncbi:MAG: N-acetylglucosamine/diacetylchitobiose ABC transporter substrate-binding protein [Thermocrispum sp.]